MEVKPLSDMVHGLSLLFHLFIHYVLDHLRDGVAVSKMSCTKSRTSQAKLPPQTVSCEVSESIYAADDAGQGDGEYRDEARREEVSPPETDDFVSCSTVFLGSSKEWVENRRLDDCVEDGQGGGEQGDCNCEAGLESQTRGCRHNSEVTDDQVGVAIADGQRFL